MSYDIAAHCPTLVVGLRLMAETIKSKRRDSSSARVPSVPPGEAIVFTRYDEEKSVVMHPDDFHRLVALDDALADVVFAGIEMSDLALEAHRVEDTPTRPLEDAAEIRAALRL